METVSYPPPWGGHNVNLGHAGYAPTSNPTLEPDRSWQPHLSAHPGHRGPHPHQHPGVVQTTSWSRNDSDSEYDSSYGLDQEPAGMRNPVAAHPEHMQNLYGPHQMDRQAIYRGRQGKLFGVHLQLGYTY